VVHANFAAFNHVDKSSRCRDEQVTASCQVLHLSSDVGAAVHDAGTHVRPVRELDRSTQHSVNGQPPALQLSTRNRKPLCSPNFMPFHDTGLLHFASHFTLVSGLVSCCCTLYCLILLCLIGPIPWGHSGPLCHALSLSLSGIVVDIDAQVTPGEWVCGGSQ